MFQKIGNWFIELFNSIKNAFLNSESGISLLGRILISIVIIIISWIIIKLITIILNKAFGIKKGLQIDTSAKSFIVSLIKVLLWVFVSFLVVNTLNIDVTSFAGIVSAITVALGLALQDVIASFASGLIIINQKNFVTGDYIEIVNTYSKVEGTVINVKLMCTLLKTFNGQVVIVPNNNVIKANITNYSQEKLRRLAFTCSASYDSDPELVKSVLHSIVDNDNRISNEIPISIHVSELGEYQVKYIIKMWTNLDDYWDVYNELSEKVLIKFKENNIKIPLRTEIDINK